MSKIQRTSEQTSEGASDRGIVPELGVLLILGFLAISYGVYITEVVPAQQRQTEFEHTNTAREDLVGLDAAISEARTGRESSAEIKLGTRYNGLHFGSSPPGSMGRLTSIDGGAVQILNAQSLRTETGDFWNGTTHQYQTQHLRYSIDYFRRQSSPTFVVEQSMVVARHSSDQIIESGQSIISGRQIALTALTGELRESNIESTDIDFQPVSTGETFVTVTNTSDPVRLQFTTRIAEDVWRNTLSGQVVSNGGHVQSISYTERSDNPNVVTITLEKGVAYQLRMGQVGVGTTTTTQSPAYLTLTEEGDNTVAYNRSTTLTVQVRDRFNNPVADTALSARVVSGPGSVSLAPNRSLDDGTARVVYQAPENGASTETVRINVSIESRTGSAVTIERRLDVTPDDGSGDDFEVTLDTTASSHVTCPTEDRCIVDADERAELPLRTSTDPATGGLGVKYSTNNSGVVFPGVFGDPVTNEDGVHTTSSYLGQEGTAVLRANVSGGGIKASDTLEIVVSADCPSRGDPCPTPPPRVGELNTSGGYIERTISPAGGGASTYITWATEVNYSIRDPPRGSDFGRVEVTAQEYFPSRPGPDWHDAYESPGYGDTRDAIVDSSETDGIITFYEIHEDCPSTNTGYCLDRDDVVEKWRYIVDTYDASGDRVYRQIFYVDYSVIEGGATNVSIGESKTCPPCGPGGTRMSGTKNVSTGEGEPHLRTPI